MLISCHDLTVSYEGHPAIHHISCHLEENRITAIVGPNGAGKSTLLKALLNLVKPDTGYVKLHNIKYSDLAYLPQVTTINTLLPLQVLDVVCTGLLKDMGSSLSDEVIEQAEESLTSVGLSGFSNRYITDLSKGELQRVMFAKIIVQKSKVIFLDEPFNAVDAKTIQDLLKVLHDLKAGGTTIVMVLHDLMQIEEYCDSAILLATELVSFGSIKQVLTRANIQTAYSTNFVWSSDICNY
jgi:zinc/manganese transport system ATP-binding protein